MNAVIIRLLVCIGITVSLVMSVGANEIQTDADKEIAIGAVNHLTVSFVLLREGVGAKSIRSDILSNVDLVSLSSEYQNLYKSLLSFSDKAIRLNEQNESIDKKVPVKGQNKGADLGELVGVATALYSGGTLPAALALLKMTNYLEEARKKFPIKEGYTFDKENVLSENV